MIPRLRPPRPTARLRLTALFGALFALVGAVLLGFTYFLFESATAGKQILPAPGASGRAVPASG